MAYNEHLTNRVRESLSSLKNVEEKRMFRGVAFMVNNKMCVTAGDDRIMCRIDPELHDKVITKKGCRTVVMRNRAYKGWVYVSEDVIKTRKLLDYWIKLALDFNKRAKASVKREKSKRISRPSTAKS
jgi:TfoX/Sxy family transcriptional regulator of competence genes